MGAAPDARRAPRRGALPLAAAANSSERSVDRPNVFFMSVAGVEDLELYRAGRFCAVSDEWAPGPHSCLANKIHALNQASINHCEFAIFTRQFDENNRKNGFPSSFSSLLEK